MVKAMKTKNMPVANSKLKYIRAFPEGTLLVADCRFPGKSLTPFETLMKKPRNYCYIIDHQIEMTDHLQFKHRYNITIQ